MKDKKLVIRGHRCREIIEEPSIRNGFIVKHKTCPYFASRLYGTVKVPFCLLLKQGSVPADITDSKYHKLLAYFKFDEKKVEQELPLMFLWDGVKECEINVKLIKSASQKEAF